MDKSKRARSGGLPADEVDTMAEKSAVLADEHAVDPEAEQPYDPGGLGEINAQPERRDQARPGGGGTGKTSGTIRRR